jgi:ABC-type antimicrobial peptide transport system permease subunit
MRINGFTVREVIGYVARETVVTTVAGIIPGIAAGALFAIKIIWTLEQMMIRFVHKPDFVAFASAGLTAVFTVIVNCIALRKVRYLKLTDV